MERRFFVGIDLGTMHTTVVGSNGVRHVIPSMVGVPRDELTRSFLKRDMIFGEDIACHQSMLWLHRPFERGTLKYGDSSDDSETYVSYAQALLKYAVELLEPPSDADLRCVLGVPAKASIHNKSIVSEIASVLGPSVLLVSEPFALAFSRESQLAEALIVDVGAGTTDICHFYGAFPEPDDQTTIGYGGDHLDLELQRTIQDHYPETHLSLKSTRAIKERYGYVGSNSEPVRVSLPVKGGPSQIFDLSSILQKTCETLAVHICEGIKALLCTIDFEKHEFLLKNILLAGGGSQLRGLDTFIERALSPLGTVQVTRIYDSVFAGAQGALNLAFHLPESCWESLLPEHV